MAEKQFLTKKGNDEREERLEELKLSTMQLRTSREISKQKLQNLKQFLLTVRLFRITIRIKM